MAQATHQVENDDFVTSDFTSEGRYDDGEYGKVPFGSLADENLRASERSFQSHPGPAYSAVLPVSRDDFDNFDGAEDSVMEFYDVQPGGDGEPDEERKVPVVRDLFSCVTPDVAPSKYPETAAHAPAKCETDERKVSEVRGTVCSKFKASRSSKHGQILISTSDRDPCDVQASEYSERLLYLNADRYKDYLFNDARLKEALPYRAVANASGRRDFATLADNVDDGSIGDESDFVSVGQFSPHKSESEI